MDESRKGMADRRARRQADQDVEHTYATRAANWSSSFERGLLLALFFFLGWSSVIFIVCISLSFSFYH